ncbi:MAG TPA: glycoside hydrolase family protein [Oscillospiraceae bacterium]|nr:glycoside hydrolase family protein [Oscillospiraceae bacterium]HPS35607.1 glycoside hydrolase family protein [Oscillospiraceae bacterium]
MNFYSEILPLQRHAVFALDEFFVWCATVQKDDDGLFHMIFSKWPKEKGFDAWVTDSVLGHAVSDSPDGPYRYTGEITLLGNHAEVFHNPTMLRHNGFYYLYFMQNSGASGGQAGCVPCDAHRWSHRNNQRIGAAWAKHPAGPWHSSDTPVIDVTPGSFDGLMVSNPTVTVGGDGKIYMVYKGVAQGVPPAGGAVVCGVARAEHPMGPFEKLKGPIMVNPENPWSVEDPFIWVENGRFYALVKDFHGYFTKIGTVSVALFESGDGVDWQPSANPLAFTLDFIRADGERQHADALERPQLVFDGGKAVALLCAFSPDHSRKDSMNVQFMLDHKGDQR